MVVQRRHYTHSGGNARAHLDEDIALFRLARIRIAVGPHDAHRLASDLLVVEGVHSILGYTAPRT